MGIKKTLGGDRLGSGQKMTQELENFGRSSHNIGGLFKTDQAVGTLVPAFCNVGTRGDTFYIDIATKVRTLPTNGPIFGVFKQQIDVFKIPFRLYNSALHNNASGIGLNMKSVLLPKMDLRVAEIDFTGKTEPNAQQIAQDSLLAYIGIRGLGNKTTTGIIAYRKMMADFLLAYWEIYKRYYANQQEEIGYCITGGGNPYYYIGLIPITSGETKTVLTNRGNEWISETETSLYQGIRVGVPVDAIQNYITPTGQPNEYLFKAAQYFKDNPITVYENTSGTTPSQYTLLPEGGEDVNIYLSGGSYVIVQCQVPETQWATATGKPATTTTVDGIIMQEFELTNIDDMRMSILATPPTTEFNLNNEYKDVYPYAATIKNLDYTLEDKARQGCASWHTMAGLGLKTYLSDRFNNWLSTEWIDGVNGINEITAVDVSDGKLTMDALILQKKVFNMLNRIAISGGTFDDWQEAVWGIREAGAPESPIYCGGLSCDIVFDEVVSNSATEDEPLGTLAGRGADRGKRGGSAIKVECTEPSMVMVINSFTPRIDYSQGNEWWYQIKTMDDFHKPNLDGIGFQDLLTEEFAAANTKIGANGEVTYNGVGKQVSWQQYMTNVSKSYGDFSAGGELSFMALNREYHYDSDGNVIDATTYIDPQIYNNAFADAKLSAKNFWVQIAFDVTCRRVMSAKQIPNL